MSRRQRVLLPLVVVACVVLLWQVMVVFFPGQWARWHHPMVHDAPAPALHVPEQKIAVVPDQVVAVAPAPVVAKAATDLAALQSTDTPIQRRYMQLTNAYQLAKLEHRLAEEKAAIAQAQLALQAVAKQIHGGVVGGDALEVPVRTHASDADYQLVYLDGQEGAEWVATLAYRGHYLTVHSDDVLANGDKVVRIDHQGVWLAHGDQQRCLHFDARS